MYKTTLLLRIIIPFGLVLFLNSLNGQCPSSVTLSFPFEESSGLTTSSSDNSTVINLTNTSWISGAINTGISFNGANSKRILPGELLNWTNNSDFAIEFWFKLKYHQSIKKHGFYRQR